MVKGILVLIIFTMFIFGCIQNQPNTSIESNTPIESDKMNQTIGQSNTFNPNSITSTWVEVMETSVRPTVIFNNELYGFGFVEDNNFRSSIFSFKLVNNDWIQVGTKKVKPVFVVNNELYGVTGEDVFGKTFSESNNGLTYKLQEENWEPIEEHLTREDVFVIPALVFKNELYGLDMYDRFTYKLDGQKWIKIAGSAEPTVVFNDELYGISLELSTTGQAVKLAGNNWIVIGTEKINPSAVFNNELYGHGAIVHKPFKLFGSDWISVGTRINEPDDGPFSEVIPKLVFKNELYGFSQGKTYGSIIGNTYKLQGDKWFKVKSQPNPNIKEVHIEPAIVFNNELYGFGYEMYKDYSRKEKLYKLIES